MYLVGLYMYYLGLSWRVILKCIICWSDVDCIHLVQDMIVGRDLVNAVRIGKYSFFTSWLIAKRWRGLILRLVCFEVVLVKDGGRDSSVGIAARYGLYWPGFGSRWEWDFSFTSTSAPRPTLCCVQGASDLFPGGKAFGVAHSPLTAT